MPYTIEWETTGVCRRFHGEVSTEDVLHSLREILAHRRFDELRYSLTDYLEARPGRVDPAHLEELAALSSAASLTNPRAITAVVATHPEVIEQYRRFREVGLSPYTMELFPTVAQARDWIEDRLRTRGLSA